MRSTRRLHRPIAVQWAGGAAWGMGGAGRVRVEGNLLSIEQHGEEMDLSLWLGLSLLQHSDKSAIRRSVDQTIC